MPGPDRPARRGTRRPLAAPSRGWCAAVPGGRLDPRPYLLPWTFGPYRRSVLDEAIKYVESSKWWRRELPGYPIGGDRAAKLHHLRRKGWRVVRVEMREVADGGD